MRKLISTTIAAMLACTALFANVACGQQGQKQDTAASSQAATGQFATLGDVFAAEREGFMSTFDDHRYVCAFSLDGTWWRVEAPLESGLSEKLNEVWTEDQAKVEELLSPLAVTSAEVLETPAQEELDALVGKTGADLAGDGFTFMVGGVVVNGNQTDCTVSKGSFDYLVTFDGAVADENTEDPAGAVASMKVVSAELQGVSWGVLEAE